METTPDYLLEEEELWPPAGMQRGFYPNPAMGFNEHSGRARITTGGSTGTTFLSVPSTRKGRKLSPFRTGDESTPFSSIGGAATPSPTTNSMTAMAILENRSDLHLDSI